MQYDAAAGLQTCRASLNNTQSCGQTLASLYVLIFLPVVNLVSCEQQHVPSPIAKMSTNALELRYSFPHCFPS